MSASELVRTPVAQPLREPRQPVRARLQLQQQVHRPQHASREDDVARGEAPLAPEEGRRPLQRLHLVATALERAHPRGLRVRVDGQPPLLSEVEVVLVQRVLRAEPAPEHAAAARDAAGALRALAVEVRIRHGDARLAEVHGHGGGLEVRAAQLLAHLLDDLIRVGAQRVHRRPEHPPRLLVVRRQLLLPVRQLAPLAVLEEVVLRDGQRVRVDERAAAHSHAGEHGDVAEERHLEQPAPPELRHPQPPLQVPVRLREVLRLEAPALLQHHHAVALLRQPQRAHAAAKP